MAYAIHIDVFIIMPLITRHNVWTELQPWCGCELMRNAWEWEWEWHVGNMGVLYLSIIRLAHKLLFAQEANEQSFCTLLERSNANCILLESGNMAMKKVSARPHQGCQSRDCHLPSRRRGKDVQLRHGDGTVQYTCVSLHYDQWPGPRKQNLKQNHNSCQELPKHVN